MKVLLDENLPLDLRHFLPGHEVFTVAYMKWKGAQNGELLSLAATEKFDVMITRDAGIHYQQNIQSLPLSVLILPRNANSLQDILPFITAILNALANLPPKSLLRL